MTDRPHILADILNAPQGLAISELVTRHPSLPRRTAQRMVRELVENGDVVAVGHQPLHGTARRGAAGLKRSLTLSFAFVSISVCIARCGPQEDDCTPKQDAYCEGTTAWNCYGGPAVSIERYEPIRWTQKACPHPTNPDAEYCAVTERSDGRSARCVLSPQRLPDCGAAEDPVPLTAVGCLDDREVNCIDGFAVTVLRDCRAEGLSCMYDPDSGEPQCR